MGGPARGRACSCQPTALNEPVSGRLRVGYLSWISGVTRWLRTLSRTAAHDRKDFHVSGYSAVRRPDEVTEQLRPKADAWHDISRIGDEAAAQLIQEDRIDILVDLGGHTAENRLLVLARRPAPVQVTHFGYPNTTGMRTIDYRLTDVLSDPTGVEGQYTERLARLPGTSWCWGPPAGLPEPGPSPVIANGFITFASLNNPAKVTEEVVAAWAQILSRVGNSRLLLLTGMLTETRDRLTKAFSDLGIDPRRLRLEPRQEADHYYAAWARQTSPWTVPYNGGVTTPTPCGWVSRSLL